MIVIALALGVLGSACTRSGDGDGGSAEAGTVANGLVSCSERIVGGGESQIVNFASDGSGRTELTTSGYNIMPTWSRDGERILFTSTRSGGVELWVMDAEGGDAGQLTFDTAGGNFTPVESPDGTRIAFSSIRDGIGHPEVWVMNADGSDQRQLTETPSTPDQDFVWSLHPTWSTDGEQIAYASTRSGSTQIWVMNADGSDQRQLTFGLGADYPDANVPSWSFDGSLIAFWSGFERRYGEIWVIEPDGSNPRQVTETADPRNSDDPHWSPDGSTIVYGQGLGGDRAMWVVPVEGGEAHLFAEGVHWCAWQPVTP
jgi:TolB protein